jgi:hypothetical protein
MASALRGHWHRDDWSHNLAAPTANEGPGMKLTRTHILYAAIAVALPVLAADGLAVKTGLWENTVVVNNTGMAIPADALAKMPPERRAQMEQRLKQMGAAGPRTITDKSCLTEKDLRDGAFRPDTGQDARNCKYTPVSATAKRQEWTFQCASNGNAATGHVVIDAVDSTHVRGEMDIKSARFTMNMKFNARWLGSSCAGADK